MPRLSVTRVNTTSCLERDERERERGREREREGGRERDGGMNGTEKEREMER